MATRIKDWEVPYVWWIWIEITNNHVINVLLRKMNNLIHVNENRELYVDLQLDDGIKPDDDFPVWVTTGKILQSDWWQQSWLILNWKTTSGDYNRLIYANDGNVYIDLWDWIWRLLGQGGSMFDCNTRTFYLPINATDYQDPDLAMAQAAYDWFLSNKNPILWYNGQMYDFEHDYRREPSDWHLYFWCTELIGTEWESHWYAQYWNDGLKLYIDEDTDTVTRVEWVNHLLSPKWPKYIPVGVDLDEPYIPTYPSEATSKKYVDDELLKKQDLLTAGTRITIQPDQQGNLVISADMSGVFIYKGNVATPNDLPWSPTVWDTYYVESTQHLYAWDGTQWNDLWGIGVDLTNYFNKNVDNSDNITQWTVNLFVTAAEKNRWNNKQDALTAGNNIYFSWADNNTINAIDTKYTGWTGITVSGTVISNSMPFNPWQWTMGQFLKKTNDWYAWADVPWGWGGETYTAWDWIEITSNNVINNTRQFNPTGTGTMWQILKRGSWNTYYWADEWGWWGWGGKFNPDNTGTPWQVLTKKDNNKYEWEDITLPSGDNNVKFWTINSNTINSDNALQQEIFQWVIQDENNWAILNDTYTNDVFIYNHVSGTAPMQSVVFFWKKRMSNAWPTGTYTVSYEQRLTIASNWTSYSTIVDQNPDDSTRSNYLSADPVGYTWAFMPINPQQPATKAYVDAVAAWSVSVPAITNNTTGTTYTVTQEWAGTQQQYDALVNNNQLLTWVIYNILPSS